MSKLKGLFNLRGNNPQIPPPDTAMASPIQANLVAKNKAYSETFTQGNLPLPPGKKYAVVTCMDARIDPASAYGIDLGDAHVIRNAGGNAVDALRSLVISQQLLGTNEILIIKHTGCGMLVFTNEGAQSVMKKNLGEDAVKELWFMGGNGDLQMFPDVEEAVVRDVEFLRGSKLIPKSVVISGWIYDVGSGRVGKVV